jgi:hypothetical protein
MSYPSLASRRTAAAKRSRYATKKRSEDPAAARAEQRKQDQGQRLKLIAALDGECCRCGFNDARGLVIVQPVGQSLTLHQLYTLALRDPELALAELRLLCATCRQIELFVYGRKRDYHSPIGAPTSAALSLSSPRSVTATAPRSSTPE